MSEMAVADVLRDAADEIERAGWWPGPLRAPDANSGERCAYTAINGMGAEDYFAQYLGIGRWSDIPKWNDAQPDAATVIAALRAAADSWKASR